MINPDMTLLDWFAGQILASGVLDKDMPTVGESAKMLGIPANEYAYEIHWPVLRAKRAYEAAKAMLKMRYSIAVKWEVE
jgi:hypothetical protein